MERDQSQGEHELWFGKYRIKSVIGRGGMSEVFLAEMTGPGGFVKKVALKRIHREYSADEHFVTSLISEARIGGNLNHVNIVQTLEFGREDGLYYIALEFVEGITLDELINDFHRARCALPLTLVRDIALQIAAGLEYIHAATDHEGMALGIVHRDLKPANIFINRHGHVKIGDFGISRAATNLRITVQGSNVVKGTVAYMSPEQAGCLSLDHRSDLYSFGVLLFELLTLESLYPDAAGLPGIYQVSHGTALEDVGKRLEGHCPPEMAVLIQRLLKRDPDERIQSAGEVRRILLAMKMEEEPEPFAWDGLIDRISARRKRAGASNDNDGIGSVDVETGERRSLPSLGAPGTVSSTLPPLGRGDPFPSNSSGASGTASSTLSVEDPRSRRKKVSPSSIWWMVVPALTIPLVGLGLWFVFFGSIDEGADLQGALNREEVDPPIGLSGAASLDASMMSASGHSGMTGSSGPDRLNSNEEEGGGHLPIRRLPPPDDVGDAPTAPPRAGFPSGDVAGDVPGTESLSAPVSAPEGIEASEKGAPLDRAKRGVSAGQAMRIPVTSADEADEVDGGHREHESRGAMTRDASAGAAHDGERAALSRKRSGYLTVNARPYAYVYLDGRKLALPTPLIKYKLPPGKHKLLFETADGRRKGPFVVDIQAGEEKKLPPVIF